MVGLVLAAAGVDTDDTGGLVGRGFGGAAAGDLRTVAGVAAVFTLGAGFGRTFLGGTDCLAAGAAPAVDAAVSVSSEERCDFALGSR